MRRARMGRLVQPPEPIRNIPPADTEAACYAALEMRTEVAACLSLAGFTVNMKGLNTKAVGAMHSSSDTGPTTRLRTTASFAFLCRRRLPHPYSAPVHSLFQGLYWHLVLILAFGTLYRPPRGSGAPNERKKSSQSL